MTTGGQKKTNTHLEELVHAVLQFLDRPTVSGSPHPLEPRRAVLPAQQSHGLLHDGIAGVGIVRLERKAGARTSSILALARKDPTMACWGGGGGSRERSSLHAKGKVNGGGDVENEGTEGCVSLWARDESFGRGGRGRHPYTFGMSRTAGAATARGGRPTTSVPRRVPSDQSSSLPSLSTHARELKEPTSTTSW